jgi:hypothetical protein
MRKLLERAAILKHGELLFRAKAKRFAPDAKKSQPDGELLLAKQTVTFEYQVWHGAEHR